MLNLPVKSERNSLSFCVLIISFLFILVSSVLSVFGQSNTTGIFDNLNPINIGGPSGVLNIANPYPSTISVNGLKGRITDINVRINGLSHLNPSDYALLLVAPNGQTRMVIQSDVGGGNGSSNDITYTLDDQAETGIPVNLEAGTYKPRSIDNNEFFPQAGVNQPPSDCRPTIYNPMPCPQAAPAGNATLNGTFGGVSPNGVWKLYVVDCCAPYSGSITNGWSLIITTDGYSPTVPILTLDAGNGIKAELSNYSLLSNGSSSGSFCFTLKNNTMRLPPLRPVYIVFVSSSVGVIPNTVGNYSIEGNFLGAPYYEASTRGIISSGFSPRSHFSKNGIPQGESVTFCMNLQYNQGVTITDLVAGLQIRFSDGTPEYYTFRKLAYYADLKTAVVFIASLSDNQMCFGVFGHRYATEDNAVNTVVVTGMGFDLPGNRGPFELISVNPSPQSEIQSFRFTTSPYQLRYNSNNTSGKLDFGILTGLTLAKGLTNPNFDPYSCGTASSVFCVRGNFSGLEPLDILNSAVVRFDNEWGIKNGFWDPCVCGGVCQPGIGGVVASNPR